MLKAQTHSPVITETDGNREKKETTTAERVSSYANTSISKRKPDPSQWSNSGNNLTTGTLRIGASIPFSTKQLIVKANNTDAVTLLDNINNFGHGLIVSAGQDILRLGSLNNQVGNVMMVKANGRIGINKTSPNVALDVNGSVYSNDIVFAPTIWGNSYVGISDETKKSRISEDFSSYTSIYDLKTYSYTYTNDESQRNHFGVMAQEVSNILPELVHRNEEKGLGVDYMSMIPLLIRAVQDQKQTIEGLQNEVQELKSKISENTELAEVLGIEGERMTIFPNPSSRVANITLKGNTRGNVSLEVVNLNGEIVQHVAANGSKSAEINTSEMLKGVYFVRYMRDGKVVETKRLLIEK